MRKYQMREHERMERILQEIELEFREGRDP